MSTRVLLVLHTSCAWSRGVLRGFMQEAHPRGWAVLHYHPDADLEWMLQEHHPDVVVLGPTGRPWPPSARSFPSIVINEDLTSEGVASVCLDEAKISELAFQHLRSRGLEHVTTFRYDRWEFGRVRDEAFRAAAARADTDVVPGWVGKEEEPAVIKGWLKDLPKPCGVYVCCDTWGRLVTQYARSANLCIPEDLCLVGVDNDTLECELITPALSSVAVPWWVMGQSVAHLVHQAVSGESIAGKRLVVEPVHVVNRRSSDLLAVSHNEVRAAVVWIQEHADQRITVPMVVAGVGTQRQRLERLFRTHLGRTILHEIRRTHVEAAKQLLATSELPLIDVAKRSGFTNSALLNQAFHREVGLPPGEYRRRARELVDDRD